MEVFKLRSNLLGEFKKGRINLTTLCGETYRAIKDYRSNKNGKESVPASELDKHYLDYLTALCRLERRVDAEFQLLKADLSESEQYIRVGSHHLEEMSKSVLEIIKKVKNSKEIQDVAMGPKGTIIILFENSPIGRVYMSRSLYMDVKNKIGKRPTKRMEHPYLKALFSFL